MDTISNELARHIARNDARERQTCWQVYRATPAGFMHAAQIALVARATLPVLRA
jgi:hypothetical protein